MGRSVVAAVVLACQLLGAGCGNDGYRVTFDTDLGSRPRVQVPEGEPPGDLVVQDVVEGDGAEVRPGATLTAHYVVVSWRTRQQIDSSWQGSPYVFQPDDVVEGWRRGLEGMRVGGRRALIVPPELAYEDGDTLVFVIDLLDVAPRP